MTLYEKLVKILKSITYYDLIEDLHLELYDLESLKISEEILEAYRKEKQNNIMSRIDRQGAAFFYYTAFGISFTSGLLLPLTEGVVCLGISLGTLKAAKYQLQKVNDSIDQKRKEKVE